MQADVQTIAATAANGRAGRGGSPGQGHGKVFALVVAPAERWGYKETQACSSSWASGLTP